MTDRIKFYCASNQVANYISCHLETSKPVRIEVNPNGICVCRSSLEFLDTCCSYLVGTESEGNRFKSQLTQTVNIVVADVMLDRHGMYDSTNFYIENIHIERFQVPSNVEIMKALKGIENRLDMIEQRLWPFSESQ